MEQRRDNCEPDAKGRVEREERRVEGRQRLRGCEVRGQEGESGVGGVESLEGLGGWVEELKDSSLPRSSGI